jgi:hypothetical protein
MPTRVPTVMLSNPYLAYFLALPPGCQRDPWQPVDDRELRSLPWLSFKAAVAGWFAWAVPTDAAIGEIARRTRRVVEIGAGSGYWAWLMSQAGIDVVAYDLVAPARSWHPIRLGDERAVLRHPDRSLFLCWPPWGSDMADRALAAYAGDLVIYVGEWLGGCATPAFFARLVAGFEPVAVVELPQWAMRDDRLTIFRRKRARPAIDRGG